MNCAGNTIFPSSFRVRSVAVTGVLNLVQNRDDAADPDAEKIEELIAQRAAAKKEKNFAEADRIRGVLADMGVTIKDTRQGTQWSRN